MKRARDLSKVIGLVGRGGMYSPSNELSLEKWHKVFDALAKARGFDERPAAIRKEEVEVFTQVARNCGFMVMTIQRGITR